jgi:hypothetical protein
MRVCRYCGCRIPSHSESGCNGRSGNCKCKTVDRAAFVDRAAKLQSPFTFNAEYDEREAG